MASLNSELSGIGGSYWLSLPSHKREEFKEVEIDLTVYLEKIEPSRFDDENEKKSWDFLLAVSDYNLFYNYFIKTDIQIYVEKEVSVLDVQKLLDEGTEEIVSNIDKPIMFLREKL